MFLFLYHTQPSEQVCGVSEETVKRASLIHNRRNRFSVLLTWTG